MTVIVKGKCHFALDCGLDCAPHVLGFSIRGENSSMPRSPASDHATPRHASGLLASQPAASKGLAGWVCQHLLYPTSRPPLYPPVYGPFYPPHHPRSSLFKPSQAYPQLPSPPSQLRPHPRPHFSPRPLRLHLLCRRPRFIPPTLLANLISDICSFQRRCGVGVGFECWIGGALATR